MTGDALTRRALLRLGVTAGAVAAVGSLPGVAAAGERPAAVPEGVRQALEQAVGEGGAPGILAAGRDGRRSWHATAGVADLATGRERRLADRFRIGSTTKAFVATVVLQLAAERRLGLDDTVERWLPGVVRGNGHDGAAMTVRQLLQHTSGVFDYQFDPGLGAISVGPAYLEHRFDVFTPEQLVGIAMTHPPAFAPGQGWGYSNTGYLLAGMIVERVTGRPLAEAIARRIARPLGLHGTSLPSGPAMPRPHGRHYSRLGLPDPAAEVHDLTELNPSFAWAAGGMVATAGDLTRFFSALFGGRLLPPAQQRALLTTVPAVPTDGTPWIPDAAYGLGIFSQRLPSGTTVWGNGGAIYGSWTYVMGTRDGTRTVAQNVNCDWTSLGVFMAALEAVFGP